MNTRMDSEYIPLSSDMVFRAVFGSPGSEAILADLMSAVRIDVGKAPVYDIQILDPFNLKTYEIDKLSVVDARARDRFNTVLNVEMQSYQQSAFAQRMLYYWARSYSGSLNGADPYERLSPVLGVAFLDLCFYDGEQGPHSYFELLEHRRAGFRFSDDLGLHMIELPKYRSSAAEQPSTGLERWVYHIRNAGREDVVMKRIKEENPLIAQAEAKYLEFISDPAARSAHLAHERTLRDRAQMIADGKAEGKAEGRREALRSVVRAMELRGFSVGDMARMTGLSTDEVNGLRS